MWFSQNYLPSESIVLTEVTAPSSPGHLPLTPEWRDWAALPGDVLFVILSRLPQADVLRGAGLACASWRREAVDEPLLWRRIDLAADEDREKDAAPEGFEMIARVPVACTGGRCVTFRGRVDDGFMLCVDADDDRDEDGAPAGWRAMARAAVDRSAGRCESFCGRADGDFLLYLVDRSPSLRRLHVTNWLHLHDEELVAEVLKKLPLLEQLVLSSGFIEAAPLHALADHRPPRLELLDAGACYRPVVISVPLRLRFWSMIKHLRLPELGIPNPYSGRHTLMPGHAVSRNGNFIMDNTKLFVG